MVKIHDVTLRDGSHACHHQLTPDFVREYCQIADEVGLYSLEVGHGNGLGASSLQVGESLFNDYELLAAAKRTLKKTKLACLAIPGFATRTLIREACQLCDIVRIGCHCTEADTTKRYIEFVRDQGKEAHGVLMMMHRLGVAELQAEMLKMFEYGATAVIFMDSAGTMSLTRAAGTENRFVTGFHAHNNLGLAVSNVISAVSQGASIIDVSACGFGAGAGNAPLEQVAAAFTIAGIVTDLDVDKCIELSVAFRAMVETKWPLPMADSDSIHSALAGVFSGFKPHVRKAADTYKVNPALIWKELGKRKFVAGQEDMVIQVAQEIASDSES